MTGWKVKDEENESDDVVSGIGECVWNVEKNGVICQPPHRNGGGVGKNGGVCPPRQIGVGKNDGVGPPRQIENDAYDVSSRCFSANHPFLHPPCAFSDDSFPSHGPSLGPNYERTHPWTAFPSRPLQLPQPSASVPTSRPPLSLLELPGQLGFEF